MAKLRACGWGLAVLLAASALALDLTGVLASGLTVPGLFIAFAVLAVMSAWQFYEMNQEIHAGERHLRIKAIGKPAGNDSPVDWRQFRYEPDNLRFTAMFANVDFEIANRGQHPYRVSRIYVEMYEPRTVRSPRRRIIAQLGPHEEPDGNGWLIEAQGKPMRDTWIFYHDWKRGVGPKNRLGARIEADLVAEIGGPDRRARAFIQRPRANL